MQGLKKIFPTGEDGRHLGPEKIQAIANHPAVHVESRIKQQWVKEHTL